MSFGYGIVEVVGEIFLFDSFDVLDVCFYFEFFFFVVGFGGNGLGCVYCFGGGVDVEIKMSCLE